MKLNIVAILILAALIGGMCIGRFACCPKPRPYDVTLTPVEPPAQGGGGILIPEQQGPYITGGTVSEIEPLGYTWHKFTDKYMSIRVRAVHADTVRYEFKKHWHEFKSELANIESLLVYGVAPESVRIKGKVPEPPQPGLFSAMLMIGISVNQHLTLHEIDLLEATIGYKRIHAAGRLVLFPVEYDDKTHLNWKFIFSLKYRIL